MRRFLAAVKSVVAVIACAASAVFAYVLISSPVFEKGERYEFYLGASSSALVVESDHPALDKLLLSDAQGESVRYAGDKVQELMKRFREKTLFTERVGETVNYYCYSPLLGKTVALNGYAVNLHLSVNAEQTAAGTPLIFGGF